MTEETYYDWTKTLSYDADITMVVATRGIGKTYGLRLQCIRDNIKSGRTFVEVCRHANELPVVEDGYFDKIGLEFPDKIFDVQKDRAYIADKVPDGKKPDWKLLGYYVGMTQYQLLKKKTFSRVKRIIMDEAVLDDDDTYHRYLRNEWGILQSIVDTVTREHAGDGTRPKLYLLGNACDVLNPYFVAGKISGMPPRGYSWHRGKTFLLDYPETSAYSAAKRHTLAGKMAEGSGAANNVENVFTDSALTMIEKRPASAVRSLAIVFDDHPISVWSDAAMGTLYISCGKPKDDKSTYVVGLRDDPSYPILTRLKPICQTMYELYSQRSLRFTSVRAHGIWQDLMEYFGFR